MFLEETGNFPGYELLDSGDAYRLERFGDFVLARPDPAVLWKRDLPESEWQKADATFLKKGEEKGFWKIGARAMPEKWQMNYKNGGSEISFYLRLTPFKHTGLFAEQSANWNFIAAQAAKAKRPFKVLNLFGYTGIGSVWAAKLGCEVTHVDSSSPSMAWAKENMIASGLPENSIRWILDDAVKFVKREIKRGIKYDAIMLDPPAFGRGAKGEVWKFNEDLPELLKNLAQITAKDFKFLIVNAYAVSVSAILLKNLLDDFGKTIARRTKVDYGELVLKQKSNHDRILSTGIFGRLY